MDKKFSHPDGKILRVLKGEVSEPTETISKKPGHEGKVVSPTLVKEGSGMVGLKNMEDNKEWAGIFNHVMRTSRLASFLAHALKEKGVDIDPETVLNTILVSHSGRRQWDEAKWYPEAADDVENKKTKTDTEISIELLERAGISETIIENVRTHDPKYPIEKLKGNWVAKVALYADYRTSQNVMSLKERFDEFEKRAIPAGRITKEQLDMLKDFYEKVEQEIFEILGNIKPEDINDTFPKAPLWENYLRRLYIQDAEESIFTKYSELKLRLEKLGNEEERAVLESELNELFPETSWWGKYVRELYEKQGGEVSQPKHEDLKTGIERAINNFD